MKGRAAASSLVFVFSGVAQAQLSTQWVGTSPGDYSDASGWLHGLVPDGSNIHNSASIDNGSTVTFDIPLVDPLTSFKLAGAIGSFGHLIMNQGEFNATGFQVGQGGQGIVEFGGTGLLHVTSLQLAVSLPGSAGSMSVDGGLVQATAITVGATGTGDLVLNSGTIDSGLIWCGSLPGSTGVLYQTGGLIDGGTINCDNDGQGVVWLQGGTSEFTFINVGFGSSGAPAQLIIDGTADVLAHHSVRVGRTDIGSFTMLGGTLTTEHLQLNQIAPGGSGSVDFQNGILDADEIFYSTGAPPTFNMSGGTLITEEFGTPALPWDLSPTGGTISPGGTGIWHTTINGDLTLGNLASIRYQLNDPASYDEVIVNGAVQLQGLLVLILQAPQMANNTYLLIDNDGVDPVVGVFDGLPEGSSFWLPLGATVYDFEISYVGGDGNDVVLVMTSCPPDLNNDGFLDTGDLALFVTLFLAGDLITDFNADSILDGADIAAFIDAFLAGC